MARMFGVAAAIALAVLVASVVASLLSGGGALPQLHGAVQALQPLDLMLVVTVLLSVAGLFVAVAASPARVRR